MHNPDFLPTNPNILSRLPWVISPSMSETVIGQFNDSSGFISSSAFDTLDRLFTVGNGTSVSSRSNAFEVYKSGKATLYGELSLTDGTDVLVYPNTDGTSGQILSTDGSGNLGWSDATDSAWGLQGNSNTSPLVNFLGTTNDSSFVLKVNNRHSGLISNSTGGNTHFGFLAGENAISADNTFIGHLAGSAHNAGSGTNTAVGHSSMLKSTGGGGNTAVGYYSLSENIVGRSNTSIGHYAMGLGTTSMENTAVGLRSLYNNTVDNNSAFGYYALYTNTKGENNTAIGHNAGFGTDSSFNSTFLGYNSYVTSNRNNITMLGANVANGQITADNQLALGNTAITSIRAQVASITAYSDARYKSKVKEDIKGLDFITRLRPVSYNVHPKELHKIWGTPDSVLNTIDHTEVEKTRYTGLIAQEVEKAAKASGYDFTGIEIPKNDKEAYALKYTEFIMPMIKAIQEQNVEVENLEAKMKLMEAENARIKKEKEDLEQRLLNIEKALEELK